MKKKKKSKPLNANCSHDKDWGKGSREIHRIYLAFKLVDCLFTIWIWKLHCSAIMITTEG